MKQKRIGIVLLITVLINNLMPIQTLKANDSSQTNTVQGIQIEGAKDVDYRTTGNSNKTWEYEGVEIKQSAPQKVGSELNVSASINGDAEALEYKFVWQKNNWDEWGVFQEFSDKNNASFIPASAGVYEIFVDVRDSSGTVYSKSTQYEIVTDIWGFYSVTTNLTSPQALNTEAITVSANTSGDTSDLQYKFVWQKNNWEQWGILNDFSNSNSVIWQPTSVGEYELYVDVKDVDGKLITKICSFSITDIKWNNEGSMCVPESRQKTGEKFQIKAQTNGNTKGLNYKFVWQKNNWEQWGVIQEFSPAPETEFLFEESGEYKIYIDIKDWYGNVTTEIIPYEIMTDLWQFDRVNSNLSSPQEKYTVPIIIDAMTSGENQKLKYKFVWEKNNWKEWDVIQDYSDLCQVEWYPEEEGDYTLYVDVKDRDGKVITKTIPFVITPVKWGFDGITITPKREQKKGADIIIKPDVSGNTDKLKYKFVWMKDDWKKWGVIKNFSEENTVYWKAPEEVGVYKIYVDIEDRDGNKKTKIEECEVVSQIWENTGIDINAGKPEQVYTEIPIHALTEGEIEGLEYKYVWQKDNWSKWGVIREFSKENITQWYPKEAGKYYIYADAKDSDGRVKTAIAEYEVLEAPWKLDEIYVEGADAKLKGETFDITAKVSGETSGLQYKFVWQKENWKQWGVIQDYSDDNIITWTPKETGNYQIYVDIIDQRGVKFDPYIKSIGTYVFNGVKLSKTTVKAYEPVTVSADLEGGAPGAQYKFVWQRNNWSKWGVIQNFSTNSSVTWTPDTFGDYTLYIDMKVDGYPTVTKTYSIHASYPYSGVTLDFLLGTSGRSIVKELEAHRYDNYYLGTRYVGLNLSTGAMDPCMHPNGSPGAGGYVGLNCTGFVAFVFQKCGANLNKISAIGGKGGYVNASNWFNFVKRNGVEYYGYSSVQALLSGGRAEKGDIIYCEPDWSRPGADCHIGIFWGDTPYENVFWHQIGSNVISNIKSATQVSTYYLIKTRK